MRSLDCGLMFDPALEAAFPCRLESIKANNAVRANRIGSAAVAMSSDIVIGGRSKPNGLTWRDD